MPGFSLWQPLFQGFVFGIQHLLRVRHVLEKRLNLVAGIVRAMPAVLHALRQAAQPHLALGAVVEFLAWCDAAVAVDVLRLDVRFIHLRPFGSGSLPKLIVIVEGGQVGRAVGADEAAEADGFFPRLWSRIRIPAI